MISKASKERVIKRLQQENARSPYLNSLPGKINSYSKLDFDYLQAFNSTLKSKLAEAISSGKSFTYYHNREKTTTSIVDDSPIQRCIKTILDKAKVNLTETGSETLAIGYPMLLERSASNTTDCKAIPLFIWPVTIKNDKVSNRWKFTFSKELPRINHSLIGFINGEEIPINLLPLYDDFLNEDLDSMAFEDLISRLDNWSSKNKQYLERIPEDYSIIEKMPFESKTAIKEASEPGIKFELYNSAILTNYKESKYSIIKDFSHFGDDIPELSEASAIVSDLSASPLDPSQFGIIEDINTRNHVVVHGPPGTGKSQTITGIITSALANDLKVAVVCQKAAAIDVLIQNLGELGIDKEVLRITNVTSDRKTVAEKARAMEDAGIPRGLVKEITPATMSDYKSLGKAVVNAYVKSSQDKLAEEFSWQDSVGYLTKIRREFPEIKKYDYSTSGKYWFDEQEKYSNLAAELDELFYELENFGDITALLNKEYRESDPFKDLRAYEQEVSTLKAYPREEVSRLRGQLQQEQRAEFEKVNSDYQSIISDYATCKSLIQESEDLMIGYPWLNQSLDTSEWFNENSLSGNITALDTAVKEVNSLLNNTITHVQSDAYQKYYGLSGLKKFFASFSRGYKQFQQSHENLKTRCQKRNCNVNIDSMRSLMDKLMSLATKQKGLLEIVCRYPENLAQRQKILAEERAQLSGDIERESDFTYHLSASLNTYASYLTAFTEHHNALKKVSDDGRLLNEIFQQLAIEQPSAALNELTKIKEKGLHLDGIVSLFQKNKAIQSPIDILARNGLSFKKEHTYGMLSYSTQEFYEKNQRHLPRTRFNNKFSKQEANLLAIQDQVRKVALYKGAVRRQKGVAGFEKRAASLAKVFALRGKNKKTLRQIAQDYTHEFTELFPVMMMTPEVTCNLFEGCHGHFDLVIVDEASQVELHDILPVLYKAKTIVVAGDEHQMPPSNFFSKQLELDEYEEEDDMEELIEVESLLEFCQNSTQFKSRYLDFHYRSNHEGLINFSNDAIYKRLVVKPTKEWDYAPFMLSRVHNGKWVNQRNEAEASRVISLLKEIKMKRGHTPHVMVATLNAPHRKEIQDQIAAAREQDEAFETRMNQLESKGFDIKNLENLQGDECELMIISTGYGPGLDDRFRQNLGVINQEKGYRLLNVLITRAKFKVILVTSIPKSAYGRYLDTLKSGKLGRGLLYAYISFVEAYSTKNNNALKNIRHLLREHGITAIDHGQTSSGDVFESPFEEEVYNFLIKHFPEEHIVLQEAHNSTGFRIDMVLRPKGKEGPRIAIECDGAAFHSGWHNQTLDVHRQRLLTSAGYDFVRIWSTDWWRDQEICEMAILKEINDIINASNKLDFETASWLTFHDELITEEDDQYDVIGQDDAFLLIEDDEEYTNEPVVTKDCIVRLSSDNPSIPEVTICIAPNQGRIDLNRPELKVLPHNGELPKALFGCKKGDKIEFKKTVYTVLDIQ